MLRSLHGRLDSIVFPKIDTGELAERAAHVCSMVKTGGTKALICIESPEALVNLREICRASRHADGLIVRTAAPASCLLLVWVRGLLRGERYRPKSTRAHPHG